MLTSHLNKFQEKSDMGDKFVSNQILYMFLEQQYGYE